MVMLGFVAFVTLTWFMSGSSSGPDPFAGYDSSASLRKQGSSTPMAAVDFGGLNNILTGGSIAPKLGNETAKYVVPRRLPPPRPQHRQTTAR